MKNEYKLRDLVSKIIVSKTNPVKESNIIIRDCKKAQVIQKNWN
jgi:hypothetical protein